MIFEKYFVPDRIFDRVEDISPEYLSGLGIRFVFSDIDNTLATYDDDVPPDNVLEWISGMESAGIRISFVSNNREKRVARFNESLGFVTRSNAGKPCKRKLLGAMRELGAGPGESLLLGDQLLTDAAAGRRAGMHIIIVKPIKDKKTPFFRFKRALERPYLRRYGEIHKNDKDGD